MPEVSRFFGIIISMYYADHNPPHFHARYGDDEAIISIENMGIIDGYLPSRVFSLVVEWALEHKEELFVNWNLLTQNRPINKIKPLI